MSAPDTVHAPQVRMYTAAYCGYCVRALRLLERVGVHDVTEIHVDRDPKARETMMRETGRRTVPQIYIGATHVGGCDDLERLQRRGELLPLLHAAGLLSPA